MFIVLFLGLQVYWMIPGLTQSKLKTRGIMSWNMYSVDYDCDYAYHFVDQSGERRPLHYQGLFRRPRRHFIVFHQDMLPPFHAFLCERVSRSAGFAGIEAEVSCSLNLGPKVPLVQTNTDICTAPDFGILAQ